MLRVAGFESVYVQGFSGFSIRVAIALQLGDLERFAIEAQVGKKDSQISQSQIP